MITMNLKKFNKTLTKKMPLKSVKININKIITYATRM